MKYAKAVGVIEKKRHAPRITRVTKLFAHFSNGYNVAEAESLGISSSGESKMRKTENCSQTNSQIASINSKTRSR